MTKGSRPDQWGASPVRAALTRKATPLSRVVFEFLDSFNVLFFFTVLSAIRAASL
jgi:hypothetical protein